VADSLARPGQVDADRERRAAQRLKAVRARLTAEPDDPANASELADILEDLGRFDQALVARQRAAALSATADRRPAERTATLLELSRLAGRMGRWRLVLETTDAALADGLCGPADLSLLEARRAAAALYLGDPKSATVAYARAESQASAAGDAAGFGSAALLSLAYRDDVTPQEAFDAHIAWAERHMPEPSAPRPLAPGLPDRRLRIGYLSGDLRDHAVAHFIEPVLAGHDPERTRLFAYANSAKPDAVTARLQGLVHGWRDVAPLNDDAAADLVRADGLDVLLDLSGHTAGNRLGILARGVAPVQATWIGYVSTTGLAAVDLRVSDAALTPPDGSERFREDLLILPRPSLAYRPPGGSPPVAPLPSATGQPPTFGSFNNVAKLSDRCLDAWAALLAAVPDSRLVLKSSAPIDDGAAARVKDHLRRVGVAENRLVVLARLPEDRDHLAAYGAVDVALDPFPYNGTTTTCEALHMGIPVVALRGHGTASRTSAMLLEAVGRHDLVADTPDGYCRIATALIRERQRLMALRLRLREDLARSPLGDGAALARALEAALLEWILGRRTCDPSPS